MAYCDSVMVMNSKNASDALFIRIIKSVLISPPNSSSVQLPLLNCLLYLSQPIFVLSLLPLLRK
jgi:hypothetical protein